MRKACLLLLSFLMNSYQGFIPALNNNSSENISPYSPQAVHFKDTAVVRFNITPNHMLSCLFTQKHKPSKVSQGLKNHNHLQNAPLYSQFVLK